MRPIVVVSIVAVLAAEMAGGTATATVSNVFFAASTNSNEDLWVGPDATATSIKNKPGTAVVNASRLDTAR